MAGGSSSRLTAKLGRVTQRGTPFWDSREAGEIFDEGKARMSYGRIPTLYLACLSCRLWEIAEFQLGLPGGIFMLVTFAYRQY